jgi:hypothetical protein
VSNIFEDLPSPRIPESRIWRGQFATTPTAVNQRVAVLLPDFTKKYKWTTVRWQPRVYPMPDSDKVIAETGDPDTGQISLMGKPIAYYLFPKRGDLCLCIFDNYRELWVVMWWPY